MFSLFKKKNSLRRIPDIVFINTSAKWRALQLLAKQPDAPVYVAWFEESRDRFGDWMNEQGTTATVLSWREVHGGITGNRPLVMIEHYPLQQKEQELFNNISNDITIYSALDEAFFRHFGGEKIAALMATMGLDENEPISHSMITTAISHAQEKLAQKVTIDHSAASMEEWMRRNVPL